MEVEEKTLLIPEKIDGNNPKKGKILTLLFPSESASAEGKEPKKDKNKPPTKVVIRRLPPKLTKEAFLEEFSPLPSHDYFHFVRGDLSLGVHAFSRAYINFLNQDDIFAFKEKYDDYGIRDDKGKTYHAVVEFAPFQRIPRRSALKKKLSKAGTLESDPKYLEFLQKLEDAKNSTTNASEYFHETESSTLKAKTITTTPLLEYLKQKKQKKMDLKNDMRQRKREADRERKRKEEEKRKADRERRKDDKGDKKSSRYEDRYKNSEDKYRKSDDRKDRRYEDKGRSKDEKKELKKGESDVVTEETSDTVIPNDPAILKVVVRQSDNKPSDKSSKNSDKDSPTTTDEVKSTKSGDSDSNISKPERKYSDFRTRLAEEKQRKTFNKRDADESKVAKSNLTSRKGVPDEKGDNCTVGSSETRESSKKGESDGDSSKKHDYKTEAKETKSKFRYSEQRNRDREFRNQKTYVSKNHHSSASKSKSCADSKEGNCDSSNGCKEKKDENRAVIKCKNASEIVTHSSRRKSLEFEREVVVDKRRSKSVDDISDNDSGNSKSKAKSKNILGDKLSRMNSQDNENAQSNEGSKDGSESEKFDDDSKKDPRLERRIRNKDRPSIEIYRPGMGKFSKQRLEHKKDDTNSTSPTGTPVNRSNSSRLSNKSIKKSFSTDNKSKNDEFYNKNNVTATKTASEVRTMTFKRSTSKEN